MSNISSIVSLSSDSDHHIVHVLFTFAWSDVSISVVSSSVRVLQDEDQLVTLPVPPRQQVRRNLRINSGKSFLDCSVCFLVLGIEFATSKWNSLSIFLWGGVNPSLEPPDSYRTLVGVWILMAITLHRLRFKGLNPSNMPR